MRAAENLLLLMRTIRGRIDGEPYANRRRHLPAVFTLARTHGTRPRRHGDLLAEIIPCHRRMRDVRWARKRFCFYFKVSEKIGSSVFWKLLERLPVVTFLSVPTSHPLQPFNLRTLSEPGLCKMAQINSLKTQCAGCSIKRLSKHEGKNLIYRARQVDCATFAPEAGLRTC